MKFYTKEELGKLEKKDFDKLYIEKLEEIEKSFDKEEYCLESEDDVLELLRLKIEELDYFLENDEIDGWNELINILEGKIVELIRIYEMFLLARENHLRGVRLIGKYLKESFRNNEIKVEDISDSR